MNDVQYTEFAKTQIKTPSLISNDISTNKVVASVVDITSETHGTDFYRNKSNISYIENNILYYNDSSSKKHVLDFFIDGTRMLQNTSTSSF